MAVCDRMDSDALGSREIECGGAAHMTVYCRKLTGMVGKESIPGLLIGNSIVAAEGGDTEHPSSELLDLIFRKNIAFRCE